DGLTTNKSRVITVKDNVVEPEINTAPVFSGVVDKTINVGDKFDKMAGVTAMDKQDGDLTPKIVVSGDVDTNKAGKNTLTYKVSDSKGLETVAKRVITVKEKPPVTGDTYDPKKVYLEGDKVIYKGKEYTAKWWTQGDAPDQSSAWEVKVDVNEDGSQEYIPGKAYVTGDVVKYNGKNYKAKWWTTSTPGSDDSWEKM
ncbi:MAG: carbohydrate-binding protein, partial [Paraclostridium sp.]